MVHSGLNHSDWGWWSINQSCFIEILEAWYERLHNKNTQKQVIVCEARHLCIPLHFRSWPVSRAMFWHLPSNSTTHWNLVVPSPWHELTKWLLPLVWGTNIKITISSHMSLKKTELEKPHIMVQICLSTSQEVFNHQNRVIISCEGLLQAVIEESAKGDGLYLWDAPTVGKWSNDQINTQNHCYH